MYIVHNIHTSPLATYSGMEWSLVTLIMLYLDKHLAQYRYSCPVYVCRLALVCCSESHFTNDDLFTVYVSSLTIDIGAPVHASVSIALLPAF